jgi:hypothetical protein
VFAWSTLDLVGLSRDVIEHRLQVNPCAKPKKQKLRKMSEESGSSKDGGLKAVRHRVHK